MIDLILDILPGLPTSLSLTFSALIVAFLLAILFTLILSLKTPVVSQAVKVYITLFTGTPLLVQFFLIYNGKASLNRCRIIQCSGSLSRPHGYVRCSH